MGQPFFSNQFSTVEGDASRRKCERTDGRTTDGDWSQ